MEKEEQGNYTPKHTIRLKNIKSSTQNTLSSFSPLQAIRKRIWKEAIRSLPNDDGDGYENVTQKVNLRCLKLYRAYSILFNSSNAGKRFWSWILKDCIKVQEKKKKVVFFWSCPRKNVKLGSLTLYSCNDDREVYKKPWCTCKVVVLFVYTYCFFAVLVAVVVVVA